MYSPKIVQANRAKLEASLGLTLKDYSLAQVQDYAYQLRDVDWSPGVGKILPSLPEELQEYIVNDLHLSKIDFRYWANRYCYILADDKNLIPMAQFWPGQEKLLSLLAAEEEKQTALGKPVKIRNVLLKSRQIGGTVIAEALGAHMTFLQPKTQSIVGSDHPDNTLKLWQTLLRMYDNLPGWMKPIPDAKARATTLHFPELDSDIVYGSGNQRTTLGQGMTVDFAHLTEVSTWQYPGYLDEDLLPAFDSTWKHHSLIILESTGHGARGNWFHDKFMAAWNKQNDFTQLFIGWFYRPTWRADATGVEIDDETRKLARRVKEEHGVDLDKEQMAWWQGKRKAAVAEGKLEIFYQEFPSVVEEAFQTGFVSAFPIEVRASLRRGIQKPVDVYEFNKFSKKLKKISTDEFWQSDEKSKWDNKLVVWERKKPGNVYVVGVDASHGIGADNAVVEVLRVGNKVQPDEQVAEYAGDIDPLLLADVAWIVGNVYCEVGTGYPAKLAIEVNPGSPGIVTQTELLRRGYPHFYRWKRPLRADGQVSREVGWWTTPATRPLLTERGTKAIIGAHLVINSPEFVKEMDTFVNTGLDKDAGVNRKYLEAAPGCHDDRIMALFIALEVAHADDLINMSEERRKFWEQRTKPPEEVVQFNTILEPWEDLIQKWEDSLVDPW